MRLTELSTAEFCELVNGERPDAVSPSRVAKIKARYGSRVKSKKGKLNALAIVGFEFRRLMDQLDRANEVFDRDLHDKEKLMARREALRDIGTIPAVSDPELRARCDADLETFARTVAPKVFAIEWSEDHYELCRSLQESVEKGGKRALAYQRGFGKTQWCIIAIIWGVLTGRLPMVMLISKNDTEAKTIQHGIQRRLETNKTLRALYPEICWVMHTLSKSQGRRSYKGRPVETKTGEMLVLPVIDGAPGSEAVIKCCGIESGSIRGSHYDRSDETTVRPKLALVDDPQDEKSAKNPTTIAKLIEIIRGAIEGLAGPNERLSVLMPVTCIAPNCLASQFTDRKKNPDYIGVRRAAMETFPAELFRTFDEKGRLNLWQQYDQIRRDDLVQGDDDHKRATMFFLQNIEEMIAGAVVRWKYRIEPPSVHPVQYLMNKFFDNRAAFMAEFQQDPLDTSANVAYLNEDQVAELHNNLDRGFIPSSVEKLVASIDIQEHVLYWQLVGYAPGFTGFITNWGAWPEQPPGRFNHQEVTRKISHEIARLHPGAAFTWAEEIEIAIRTLAKWLLNSVQQQERLIPIDAVGVDARWEKIEKIVLKLAGEEGLHGRLIPMGGQYVGPNRPSLSNSALGKEQTRADRSCEWVMAQRPGGVYMIEFDANHYRTKVQTGLAKGIATDNLPGRITYNGRRGSRFLASHLTAKKVELVEGQRRTIEAWKNKPGADQDHWLDCLVMTRVLAEHEGMRATGVTMNRPKTREVTRKKITQADVPQQRRR